MRRFIWIIIYEIYYIKRVILIILYEIYDNDFAASNVD